MKPLLMWADRISEADGGVDGGAEDTEDMDEDEVEDDAEEMEDGTNMGGSEASGTVPARKAESCQSRRCECC